MEIIDNEIIVFEDKSAGGWWVVPLDWLIATYRIDNNLYISFYTDYDGGHKKVSVDQETYNYIYAYLHPKVIKLF